MFFFSSRRRHTRYWRDWSSDVCSSDLTPGGTSRQLQVLGVDPEAASAMLWFREDFAARPLPALLGEVGRSEERRVGKSVDLGGRRIIKKKKNKHTSPK